MKHGIDLGGQSPVENNDVKIEGNDNAIEERKVDVVDITANVVDHDFIFELYGNALRSEVKVINNIDANEATIEFKRSLPKALARSVTEHLSDKVPGLYVDSTVDRGITLLHFYYSKHGTISVEPMPTGDDSDNRFLVHIVEYVITSSYEKGTFKKYCEAAERSITDYSEGSPNKSSVR